ncbi:MAG: RNA polymerase sigma factor [Bryobacteraceae bacterium]
MNYHTFDAEYIRRLASGDRIVEDHFTAYFSDLLFYKLRLRLRCAELAEDIRQETLMRVLVIVRERGVEHPERFGAFVNSVCNNVKLEYLRHETRTESIDEEGHDAIDKAIDMDAPILNRERRRNVEKVLAGMHAKDRDLLRMYFLEEADRVAVCARFGVSEEYLRVLLHRAKTRYRESCGKSNSAAV